MPSSDLATRQVSPNSWTRGSRWSARMSRSPQYRDGSARTCWMSVTCAGTIRDATSAPDRGARPRLEPRRPFAALRGDQAWGAARPGRQHPHGVQAVAAEVHHGAAGERQGPARVAVRGGPDRDHRLHPAQLAEFAAGEEFVQAPGDRVEEV